RSTIAVWRRLHHADPVVRRARRERRAFAEAVPEPIGDRDRARRAGLLAHEARLALEDARLRLEQEGDQPARSLRQIALLVRIFPRHRTRMHKVLERAEHSREDSSHPLAPTLSARPK